MLGLKSKHDGERFIVVETPCFDKNLPASTENLPLKIRTVEHTPKQNIQGQNSLQVVHINCYKNWNKIFWS